jgi:hypothetical protein
LQQSESIVQATPHKKQAVVVDVQTGVFDVPVLQALLQQSVPTAQVPPVSLHGLSGPPQVPLPPHALVQQSESAAQAPPGEAMDVHVAPQVALSTHTGVAAP